MNQLRLDFLYEEYHNSLKLAFEDSYEQFTVSFDGYETTKNIDTLNYNHFKKVFNDKLIEDAMKIRYDEYILKTWNNIKDDTINNVKDDTINNINSLVATVYDICLEKKSKPTMSFEQVLKGINMPRYLKTIKGIYQNHFENYEYFLSDYDWNNSWIGDRIYEFNADYYSMIDDEIKKSVKKLAKELDIVVVVEKDDMKKLIRTIKQIEVKLNL